MSDEDICQRLNNLETQIQSLIQGQESIKQILTQLRKPAVIHSKKPPPKVNKQEKSLKSSTKDVSKLLLLSEALQRNLVMFTDDLTFNQTRIPDQLISTGCLSEDECATILLTHSEKDKARSLVRKIRARGPQVIETFLDIVGEDHSHLKEEVYKTLDKLVNEADKQKPKCIICIMQQTVDLRDIGDYLFQEKLLSDDIHGYIYDTDSFHRNKSLIWSDLLECINNYDSPNAALEILKKALQKNYSHIVEYLEACPERSHLSCSCCIRRRVRPRRNRNDSFNLPSLTDESTTSEQPNFSSSLKSLDSLTRYDSIGKHEDKNYIHGLNSGITSKQLEEIKENYQNNAHTSGYFEPQNNSEASCSEMDLDKSLSMFNEPAESKNLSYIDKNILQIKFEHSISTESTTTVCEGPEGQLNDSTSDHEQISSEKKENTDLRDLDEPAQVNDDIWKEILSEPPKTEHEGKSYTLIVKQKYSL